MCWCLPFDSGVLNITDYVTPDPWQAFFGQKRYGADIYDIYGQVIEGQGRLAALRFGGDGDELKRGGKPPVNHVNIVAQQALPVTLNEQGEARLHCRLAILTVNCASWRKPGRQMISVATKAK
ncbi:putative protease inhibitor [Escherichia coli]|uniref:Putative protease inhibitor n=1 Tax=Escherichia coli TaxID=562 RepID=A0A2X3K8L7_ECOLX|nr:putative protease inhibitor [Escherichia coli]